MEVGEQNSSCLPLTSHRSWHPRCHTCIFLFNPFYFFSFLDITKITEILLLWLLQVSWLSPNSESLFLLVVHLFPSLQMWVLVFLIFFIWLVSWCEIVATKQRGFVRKVMLVMMIVNDIAPHAYRGFCKKSLCPCFDSFIYVCVLFFVMQFLCSVDSCVGNWWKSYFVMQFLIYLCRKSRNMYVCLSELY